MQCYWIGEMTKHSFVITHMVHCHLSEYPANIYGFFFRLRCRSSFILQIFLSKSAYSIYTLTMHKTRKIIWTSTHARTQEREVCKWTRREKKKTNVVWLNKYVNWSLKCFQTGCLDDVENKWSSYLLFINWLIGLSFLLSFAMHPWNQFYPLYSGKWPKKLKSIRYYNYLCACVYVVLFLFSFAFSELYFSDELINLNEICNFSNFIFKPMNFSSLTLDYLFTFLSLFNINKM